MPLLRRPHHQPDGPPHHTGLPHVPLPRMPANVQRAHGQHRSTICPVPTDVAVLAVLWRLQYKLSLRNVAEMFLTRGFTFTSEGTLGETMPSKTRDMDAAKTFFVCILKAVGQPPEKVTTDGHDSYPRAVRETLGPDVIIAPAGT